MTFSLASLQSAFEQLIAQDPLPPPPPAPAPAPDAASAPATPPPPAAAPVPPQVQAVDFAARGFDLDLRVRPAQVMAAATIMDQHGFALDAVSGVDWMAAGEMEVVYDFFHPTAICRAVVRTRVPRTEPALPTISSVYAGANWHERETAEFFGIQFLGHPNLIPLLLPEDSTFHPLRKDYAP